MIQIEYVNKLLKAGELPTITIQNKEMMSKDVLNNINNANIRNSLQKQLTLKTAKNEKTGNNSKMTLKFGTGNKFSDLHKVKKTLNIDQRPSTAMAKPTPLTSRTTLKKPEEEKKQATTRPG